MNGHDLTRINVGDVDAFDVVGAMMPRRLLDVANSTLISVSLVQLGLYSYFLMISRNSERAHEVRNSMDHLIKENGNIEKSNTDRLSICIRGHILRAITGHEHRKMKNKIWPKRK